MCFLWITPVWVNHESSKYQTVIIIKLCLIVCMNIICRGWCQATGSSLRFSSTTLHHRVTAMSRIWPKGQASPTWTNQTAPAIFSRKSRQLPNQPATCSAIISIHSFTIIACTVLSIAFHHLRFFPKSILTDCYRNWFFLHSKMIVSQLSEYHRYKLC